MGKLNLRCGKTVAGSGVPGSVGYQGLGVIRLLDIQAVQMRITEETGGGGGQGTLRRRRACDSGRGGVRQRGWGALACLRVDCLSLVAVVAGNTGRIKPRLDSQMPSSCLPTAGLEKDTPWL